MDQNHDDLTFPPWEWAPNRLISSPPHCGTLLDSPLVLKYAAQPVSDFHSSLKKELDPKVLSFNRTPPPGGFLSLSLLQGFEPPHLNSLFHQEAGSARSCIPDINPVEDEEALSPLDWTAGLRSLLASPFSNDSDSDDGLAPSPFSSPEPSIKSETDEETRGCFFSPPSTPEQGHGYLGDCPSFELYLDRPNDNASLSFSTSSSVPTSIPDGRISLSASPTSSSYGNEEDLPSLSHLPAPLPVCNSFYHFDHPSSAIPGSPRYRAVDLPAFEDEIDSKAIGLGLGLLPTYPFGEFGDEVPPPPGFSQRTTWLSLPGADTDDDLIPAELGSKTYIPDPSITIATTPPSRSLLIWDPTTRSGLPAGLPSFDGTSHTTHRFDVDALSIRQPHSLEEDFDVCPALLARVAEKDAEKGMEVQKLCELKQRTTIAAAAACRGREGAQLDVERVREKWREVTALLRLKLASDDGMPTTIGLTEGERECASSRGGDDGEPSSPPLLGVSSRSPSRAPSASPPSTPEALTDSSSISSTSDCSIANSSTSPHIRHRISKPKITSMAQLVANMVFHRQQDALRRSPIRSRTWSPVSSMTNNTASGKSRSCTQTSPTSPLRQMILPEDLDNSDSNRDIDCDTGDCVLDTPLQLSPLSLSLCRSPESFYAQLESTSST